MDIKRTYAYLTIMGASLLLFVAVSFATESHSLIDNIVSLSRVIVTPERYIGRDIQTYGYFSNGGKNHNREASGAICNSLDDVKYGVAVNCIGVTADKKYLDGFVHADLRLVVIDGTFTKGDSISVGESAGTIREVKRFEILKLVPGMRE